MVLMQILCFLFHRYHEQPLPSGPPKGEYPGAEWKRQLCFRNSRSRDLYMFVLECSSPTSQNLWRDKYRVRNELAKLSGNPGNSCIHLTDNQSEVIAQLQASGSLKQIAAGCACNDSYAFKCGKALLHPESLAFLNGKKIGGVSIGDYEFGDKDFRRVWRRYCDWLESDEEELSALLVT
jgi:hypothetical protein